MTEKTTKTAGASEQQVAIPIVPCEATEPKRIVCPMCGHANPDYTAICKKCSNYLM